jgi:hypothetical protein
MRMKKGRKKMKTREINLKLSVGGLRLNIIVIQDPMIIFYDNQMVKVKKNDKVFGGLHSMLFHLKHLRLNVNGMDQID